MDEDAKTLLAILALIYGSSNGVGLFKGSLDPVVKRTAELDQALNDPGSAASYVRARRKKLFRSLWGFGVLVYVALVLIPIAFLVLVVWKGPDAALVFIGLPGDAKSGSPRPGLLFYWVLLGLSSASAIQLLSEYRKAWGAGIRAFFSKSE